ncbi:hypothetical protein DCAR_0520026 [Daucus carota subsp. sativus]|uniref:DUF4218 domain-containing protein n=1 Tax=Daucus carota subsp. sativus TaxID=79200 RepID=A0AAF1B150_DAUCS|nr:hypothetical protein DCAR_0520026 [Daucus carota subsp. sativus]
MYPFERFLRHLKNNIKNKARVEGSMCNAYLVEEASTFCSHYFEQHVQTKHRKVPRNDSSGGGESFEGNFSIFSHPGRASGCANVRYLDDREYMAAHNYVLLNCPEVAPYTDVYEPFILASQAMQVYFCNYPSLRRDKMDWLVVCKIKARPLVELSQAPQSHQEPYQDETPENLNRIDIRDIPTHLNDNEGILDLDDGEGSPEEEIEFDSDSEEGGSSQSDDIDNNGSDYNNSSN